MKAGLGGSADEEAEWAKKEVALIDLIGLADGISETKNLALVTVLTERLMGARGEKLDFMTYGLLKGVGLAGKPLIHLLQWVIYFLFSKHLKIDKIFPFH